MSSAAAQHVKPQARWKIVSLSDVAEVVNGGTPKSKVARYWGGDVQWLTPKDMGQMEGREIAATPRTISKEGLANSSAQLVPANSVILSTRAPIGHLAINTAPMAFNQGCRGIVPGAYLDTIFLYYFLLANKQRLNDLGSGTTFKELSASRLKSVQLPLPPLEEQKRIAAVLDRAFAALDRARANVTANLADATELFESQRTALLAKVALGSPIRNLGSISSRVSVGHVGETSKYYVEAGGIPFIRSQNVRPSGLDAASVRQINRAFHAKLKKSQLVGGELLFVRVGANRSDCCKVPVGQGEMNCANIVFARPIEGNLPYLENFCQSRRGRELLLGMTTGSAQGVINTRSVAKLPIPFPELGIQESVVARIDAIRAVRDQLSEAYRASITDLGALRQSLLQKAFAGQLA